MAMTAHCGFWNFGFHSDHKLALKENRKMFFQKLKYKWVFLIIYTALNLFSAAYIFSVTQFSYEAIVVFGAEHAMSAGFSLKRIHDLHRQEYILERDKIDDTKARIYLEKTRRDLDLINRDLMIDEMKNRGTSDGSYKNAAADRARRLRLAIDKISKETDLLDANRQLTSADRELSTAQKVIDLSGSVSTDARRSVIQASNKFDDSKCIFNRGRSCSIIRTPLTLLTILMSAIIGSLGAIISIWIKLLSPDWISENITSDIAMGICAALCGYFIILFGEGVVSSFARGGSYGLDPRAVVALSVLLGMAGRQAMEAFQMQALKLMPKSEN